MIKSFYQNMKGKIKIIRKLRPIDNKIKNLSDATSNIVLNMELYKGKTIMSGKDFVNSVRYSQKFRRKHGFSNLVNGSTSQFRFPKYLIEYQNVKNRMTSKLKTEKSKKKKHKTNVVIKEMYYKRKQLKKRH